MVALGRAAVAVFAICALSSAARADDDPAQARQHFEEGSKLYDLGQYLEAAHEYEIAYKFKADPALLFNIGQAYRLGGDKAAAIRAYRGFLRRAPEDSPNRPEVESQIATLQKLVDEEKRSTTSPPVGTLPPTTSEPPKTATTPPPNLVAVERPAPPPHRPLYKRWWFWTAIGGGVAAAAVVGVAVAYSTPKDAPLPAGATTLVFP